MLSDWKIIDQENMNKNPNLKTTLTITRLNRKFTGEFYNMKSETNIDDGTHIKINYNQYTVCKWERSSIQYVT